MSTRMWVIMACAALILAVPVRRAGAQAPAAPAPAMTGAVGETQTGEAAVYGKRLSGHKTASGQRYHGDKLTASHPTLPFGTEVKVTNLKNNKSVTVRIMDLSSSAAHKLGIHHMAEVKIEVVKSAKG